MESPSIFGSATKTSGSVRPRNRLARAQNSANSVASKTLSSDSIGTRWRTLANPLSGAPPTRVDGESARISAGKRASIAALRRRRAS